MKLEELRHHLCAHADRNDPELFNDMNQAIQKLGGGTFLPRMGETLQKYESGEPIRPHYPNQMPFIYIRDRLALTQKLMTEKTVSLNEQERRARHDEVEAKQLALENIRRKAKGEEPLKELKKEDEDALPAEDEDTRPEDDAYLSETGRILIDYLSASTKVAKK